MLVNNEGKRHQGLVHGDADYGFPFPPEDTLEIFGMEIIFPNIYQMCEKRFINSLIWFNVILRFWKLINRDIALKLYILLLYRKIQKKSSGAYIFQKPFLRGLFLDGAYIRRGLSTEANLRFKIDWASLEVNLPFLLCLNYFVFEGNFPSTRPRGHIFGVAI